MYQAMAEEEQKKAAQIQIASPLERKNSKISVDRGFASKAWSVFNSVAWLWT